MFPIIFKLISQYQNKNPILMTKHKYAKCQTGSFHGGRNPIKLVMNKKNRTCTENPKICSSLVS